MSSSSISLERKNIDKKEITAYRVQDLLSLLDRQERWVDRTCINFMAGTNVPSASARRMLGGTSCSRAAEGDIGKKFFQVGVEYLEEIERVAVEALKYLYHAEWADCRVQSGTLANVAVEIALCSPGDTIMSISLSSGSHTSHTRVGFPVFYGLNVVDVPFDNEKIDIDLDKLERVLKELNPKPKMMVLGGSLFLFQLPVKEVRALLDQHSPETVLVFDAAHVNGIIAGGAYPRPLDDGAQIMTASSYKSLGGPPGGFIVGNDIPLFRKVKRAVYPGLTTNFHYHRIGALAVTCLELIDHGRPYAEQIVRNSRALGAALDSRDFNVVGKERGYSDTHQILVALPEGGIKAFDAGNMLADANIITSPQLLPTEPPENVRNPRGIRFGTQEVTRWGMREAEMGKAADFIADVLLKKADPCEVGKEVAEFRGRFQELLF